MASADNQQASNGLPDEHEKGDARTLQGAGDLASAAPGDRAVTPPNREGDENSEGTKKSIVDAVKDPGSDSRTDGTGERPVRQKLEETSIAGTGKEKSSIERGSPSRGSRDHPMASQASQSPSEGNVSESSRGRLKKKRSFDDIQGDDGQAHEEESGHRRKRSRDSKSEDDDEDGEQEGLDQSEKLMSPKKKRSRDQFDKEHNLKSENTPDKDATVEKPSTAGDSSEVQRTLSPGDRASKGEPEKKRHRDNSRERSPQDDGNVAPISKVPKSSLPNPFSNTSSKSPFGALDQAKESGAKEPATSASAFAGSSLAAFAGTKSPFGGLAGSTSVFKSPDNASEPEKQADKGTSTSTQTLGPSPFSSSGPSPFAAPVTGGFAQSAFASSFASAAPSTGARLSSFASPSVKPLASKAKAFGATSDDEDEGNGEAEEETSVKGLEEEKMDERFSMQETETGEEHETTHFSCRGKLFHFTGKEWKERGAGTFKINVRDAPKSEGTEAPDDGDVEAQTSTTKKSARLIMRNDGVLKVILNIPLFKGMVVGEAGKEPIGKQISISGIENGKVVPLMLRAANIDAAKGVYHAIQDLLKQI